MTHIFVGNVQFFPKFYHSRDLKRISWLHFKYIIISIQICISLVYPLMIWKVYFYLFKQEMFLGDSIAIIVST